eukprot:7952-Heterococcus_DN1.PRE.2
MLLSYTVHVQVKEILSVSTAGELAQVPEAVLRKHFGEKTAAIISEKAKGIDLDPVEQRALPKSVSCGKTFYGNTCLRSKPSCSVKAALTFMPIPCARHDCSALDLVGKWLKELAGEIDERLQKQRTEHK